MRAEALAPMGRALPAALRVCGRKGPLMVSDMETIFDLLEEVSDVKSISQKLRHIHAAVIISSPRVNQTTAIGRTGTLYLLAFSGREHGKIALSR